MSFEDQRTSGGTTEKTARTVGQLVKYSREVNQSETVDEVGTYALEATYHVMDGHPAPTVFEVVHGDARVLESMTPTYSSGDPAGPIAERACETGQTVIVTDDETAVGYETDDCTATSPGSLDEPPSAAATIAAPSFHGDEAGDSGVILQVQWDVIDAVEEYHVKPVEYLADHVATAVANIRSREQLERARNDLAKRKEMVEMYDRLLRHDLGNDLQVINGFSDALATAVDEDDDQLADYAEKIQRTSRSAADLIGRVGDLVRTLEHETEPAVRDLEPILTDVVADVESKFEDLTVEYDPSDFETQVYTGDLVDSVFTNVLSNAVAHNDVPVTASVYAAETTPGTITVGVADDGRGIPDGVRDDIFQIGEKGPESDGTGFGLGIARALVQSYGGSVSVTESDSGGADFRITLERA